MKEIEIKKEFWPNGQLREEWGEIDGKKEGVRRAWHENGQLAHECMWVNGKRVGEWRSWWPGGQLESSMWFEAGERHGSSKAWYPDGTLRREGTFVNDLHEGVYKEFYPNGKLGLEIHYYHDEVQFKGEYFLKGSIEAKERFFEDGKVFRLNEYHRATMDDGKEKKWMYEEMYHRNGQTRKITRYVNGKKDGVEKEWHSNGKLVSEKLYKNDMLLKIKKQSEPITQRKRGGLGL